MFGRASTQALLHYRPPLQRVLNAQSYGIKLYFQDL